MSGTASLCLQLVADRLLDAVVLNAGGRPEAALAGRQLALPRAAFLRVLRAAAPRTVARVSPERALAHIAATARDPGPNRSTGEAQRRSRAPTSRQNQSQSTIPSSRMNSCSRSTSRVFFVFGSVTGHTGIPAGRPPSSGGRSPPGGH